MSTQSIYSIGSIACRLQRSVPAIRAAAERNQIQPAMRINGVDHFSDEDVDRIATHVNRDRRPEGRCDG